MTGVARHSGWSPALILLTAAAALILAVSMGLRQSLGLFLAPMTGDIGVSAAAFGMAMAIQNLAWGISQPFVGMLADRHGSRWVVTIAALIYALGLLLMAKAGAAGLQLGGGLLIGLAVAGSAFGVVLGAVSRAAPAEKRAMAVSIVSAAGSLGTMALAPIGQYLIDVQGWQAALIVFAAVGLVMAVAAWFMDGERGGAGNLPPQPSEAVKVALAHRGFMAMTIAFFACGFQLIFIATHLPKYLSLCGIEPGVGAAALGLIGLFNAIGTFVIGNLGARYGNKEVLALVYLLRTVAIAIFVLAPVTVESTLIFASVMGLLWLSVAPLVSGLITSMFGVANFGTLFGLMFLSHQVGSFLGAWLGGLSYDLSGSYAMAWWSLVLVGVLAALLQFSADETVKPVTAKSAA